MCFSVCFLYIYALAIVYIHTYKLSTHMHLCIYLISTQLPFLGMVWRFLATFSLLWWCIRLRQHLNSFHKRGWYMYGVCVIKHLKLKRVTSRSTKNRKLRQIFWVFIKFEYTCFCIQIVTQICFCWLHRKIVMVVQFLCADAVHK